MCLLIHSINWRQKHEKCVCECVCVSGGVWWMKERNWTKNERFVNSVWNKLNDFIVSVCVCVRAQTRVRQTYIAMHSSLALQLTFYMIRLKCGIQPFGNRMSGVCFSVTTVFAVAAFVVAFIFRCFLVRFFRRYFVNELSVVQNETILYFF